MPRDDIGSYYGAGPNEGFSGLPSYEQILANLGVAPPATLAEFAPPSQNWADPSWGTWGGGKSFRAPTELELARGSMPDAAKGAENDFAPSQQNAMLLKSLGFGGEALRDGAWTGEALRWLHSNGYQLGVGHAKGSESGGRPEYWGLIDSNGQFVQGQSDPTMTISDTPMEIATPFLMMLPAIAGIAAAGGTAAGAAGAGGASGGAGAAGGAGASGSIGTLGAAETGVTSLGSAWSPSALGIEAVAPSVSAGEIAALGSGIPSVAPSITDLALQGAMRGAVTGGAKSLVQGENPLTGAFQGALGGAVTGGIGGGVNAINPGGAGWINSGITGGITSAIGGGNPLIGAAGGALGSLASSVAQPAAQPAPTSGGDMDFGDVGGWFSDWNPDSLNLGTDIAGNVMPNIGGDLWNPTYADWVTNALFPQSDSGSGSGSGWFSNAVKGLLGGAASQPSTPNQGGSGLSQYGGLAALIGAGLGASQGGKTETSTRQTMMDPRFDPYVFGSGVNDETGILGAAKKLWQDNRSGINPVMQAGLDMQRSALQDPAYGQAFQQMRTQGMGLLNQPIASNPFTAPAGAPGGPAARAGGVGGLLGGGYADRAKALMASGRGLLG